MNPVLVDTSAWVDFLRAGARPLGDRVDELLDTDQARFCGIIVAELLHGVRGAREQKQIHWLLEKVRRVQIVERDWDDAGNLMRRLREQGITVSLTDALIATVAKRNGIAELTADDHFRHLGVDLYAPSDDY